MTSHFAISGSFRGAKQARLESFSFCEDRISQIRFYWASKDLPFLNLAKSVFSQGSCSGAPHKMREDIMASDLFPPGSLPPLARWDRLFQYMPPLRTAQESRRGRRRIPRQALLNSHIYRALRGIPRLVDLAFELGNNPSINAALGFDPLKAPPSVERLSRFLRDTPNERLSEVHHRLGERLIEVGAINPTVLAIDSCPVPARVKENNMKTGLRKSRFNKERPPKGDPEARLGVMVHFPSPQKKEVVYFWGYRNHVVSDAQSEVPLWEITFPANVSEVTPAKGLLKDTWQSYRLDPEAVVADAEYDVEDILRFIVKQMEAFPAVPANPRNKQTGHYRIEGNKVICTADLPMLHKGRMTVKGITYIQYVCPLHYSKKERQKHLFCPALHPKYTEQKGCNALIRITPTVRSKIPYGSREFKRYYNQRTAAERVFSRLLAIAMQYPTVKGLKAVSNYCTVAHIATSLVALAAHQEGHADKLRYVRTFVPEIL